MVTDKDEELLKPNIPSVRKLLATTVYACCFHFIKIACNMDVHVINATVCELLPSTVHIILSIMPWLLLPTKSVFIDQGVCGI